MSLSSLAIARPIATTLLAIGLALAGWGAFKILPLASLPKVDFPTITVTTQLPGSSPENMASSVTAPLERFLGHIAGIVQMTSSSTLGLSRIILQFDLSRDIDGASRDVQSAINAANSQLPTNLPTLPAYRKINPSDSPIIVLALTSDSLTRGQMYDIGSTILMQKLSQVDGVGQVIVNGGSLPAVRVELNPTTLNSYGIGLPNVAAAIAAANVNRPKGLINLTDSHLSNINTNDQLFKPQDYASLIIGYQNNSPVRISDVGYVHESIQDIRNSGLFNGKSAVFLAVFRQPGANIIQTVDRVMAALPQLKAIVPTALQITIAVDRTRTIRVSLHDVELTLIVAMLLVIFVTYLFLGNIRAMFIPGIAVPLSLLGTFCVMELLGFSLNNISFMALIISTGFVVDDAVVVLENISRHLEKGVAPIKAAIDGAKEVSFTVVAMSLSLIAVFIPILLMGGLVGRLFREFAVTLSVAILISMVISLTVTPMMCSRFLRIESNKKPSWIDRVQNKIHIHYQNTLEWSLNHERFMLLVTGLTFILTIVLFSFISKGFFPQQDTGQINGTIQIDENLSFQALNKKLTQFADIIKKEPGVQDVTGVIGGVNNLSPGSMYITLKPTSERDGNADDIINRLRDKVNQVAGAILYLQASQDLIVGGRQANAQFQYTLFGDNLVQLNEWTTTITKRIKQLPGLTDVSSDQRAQGLQMFVKIDYDAALRFGITTQQIDKTLYNAFGQSNVSIMFMPMNQYFVVMEVAPKFWQRPETLSKIYVTSSAGNEIPLSDIAKFTPSSTLLSVNHQGQVPSSTISFNLFPGVALKDAVDLVNKTIDNMQLPANIHGSFQGTALAFQASLANQPYLILFALLTVYIVLGILYESFIHPVTILSTLPSAGVGALLALILTRTDMTIIAFIGIILLIGIVKKNAIMMIDFALDLERTEKKSPREAIFIAALMRFRPIMMTTLAAMLGAVPLILAVGLGSELRRPLGIAIFGGLLVSQLLTLYTTPVVYLAMENFTRHKRRKRK